MYLASIMPGGPSHVRVYACCLRARRKVVDVKFTRTPDPEEVRALIARPSQFVEALDGPGEAA